MAGFIPTGVIAGAFACTTTDPLDQFLYVGSSDTGNQVPAGQVQIYSIDPASGNLSAVAGSPFAFNPGGGCIDFEPTGKFGYASVDVNSTTVLLTYSRNSVTGGLTVLNSANLGGVPARAAIDPLGKYLYVDIFTNGFLSAAALGFSIDATERRVNSDTCSFVRTFGCERNFHVSSERELFVHGEHGRLIN